MLGKPAGRLVLARMIREIEMSGDWFGCVLVIFSTSRRCSRKRSPSLLPVSPKAIFFAEGACCTIDDICGGACEAVSECCARI